MKSRRPSWWSLSPTIQDDAGADVVVDMHGWRHMASWHDPRTRPVLNQAVSFISSGGGSRYRGLIGRFPLLWGLTAGLLFATGQRMGLGVWMLLPIVAMLGLVVGQLMRWGVAHGARLGRDHIVTTLTHHGMCPACAYDFFGLTANVDGRVRCPECGGEWNASRLRQVAPVHDVHEATIKSRTRDFLALSRLSMRRGATKDDRGVVVPLMQHHPKERLKRGEVAQDSATRVRFMKAHKLVRRAGAVRRLLLASWMAVAGLVPIVIFLIVRGGGGGVPSPMIVMLVLNGVVMLAGWQFLRSNIGMKEPRARAQMLATAICPSCAQDLAPQPVEEDGLRTCPGCGSGWRIEPGDYSQELPKR